MAVINPQQYQLREERTGRIFLAHRSRLRKTSLEKLAEDGQRTVLLRPGKPLDSAMDSTVMGEDLPHDSRSNELKDEILQRPRQSETERIPEPEKRTYSSRQQSQAV